MQVVRKKRGGRALISLTPLIDVVFILLVFFMLASSFTEWRAIDLATSAKAVSAASVEGAVLVRVRADGGLDIAGERLDAEALAARMTSVAERNPDRRVAVQPDAGVPLQRVVTVMETVTAAGLSGVSIVRGPGG
ncbi:Biopolymer transport protein ExbD/TolR [Caenispirillum salinarum AK4]|uniref:Biopolymer transport protein ExbD/TolR n=1 Tax=Caenispirillum salinarum AK4 TaxID=1238182 RepID=K9GUT9_9PROT|nr:biopolymer transporter ExbD [Caenispirillum salinarum]EKV28987.1 Biopolymer transport protein ExbD/TolR [Caenispirillum salinarum AK4]